MIYDLTENAERYRGISAYLDKAIAFAANCSTSIHEGRHEIDGDKVFALVSNYNSKHKIEGNPEAHKKYIDLQMVLEGEEYLYCGFLKEATKEVKSIPENDVAFYEGDCIPLHMAYGKFAIVFPWDIHQPGVCIDKPAHVKKLVIKIEA